MRIYIIFFLIVLSFSCNENTKEENGREIFKINCISCHGIDGKKGVIGAKDLSISDLEREEIKDVILNGRNNMLSFENLLKEEQIDSLVVFVESLRK